MSDKKKNKRKRSYVHGSSTKRNVPSNEFPFDIDSELRKAVQYHESGQLEKAEEVCVKILRINPNHSESSHLLGLIAHHAGKDDLAISSVNKAIQNDPKNPFYYNNLGNIFQDQGKLDEAISCYQKALQLKPDLARPYNNMGNAFKDQGKLNEAISCYQKALDLQPDYSDAYYNMGIAFEDQNNLNEAISCYQQAIHLKPDYFAAYNNMGNAFKDQGKLDEAISCCQKALQLKPDYAAAYNNMGNALTDQDNLDEAISCYQKALQLKPDYAEACNNMGIAFKDQAKLDEALSCYQKALQLKPDYAAAYNNMGVAFQNQGNFDEGNSCFRKALELKPDNAQALYSLVQPQKLSYYETQELFQLAEQLSKQDMSEDDSTLVYFALGKLCDDLGMFEKAFEYYRLANTLAHRKVEFRIDLHREYISKIIQTFTDDLFYRRQTWGSDSKMPIFIVGMPRSGTTLVEQIISSHPDVLGAGELSFFFQIDSKLKSRQIHSLYPEYVQWVDRETAHDISEGYLGHLRNLAKSSANQSRVTDKMPHNYLLLGLMFLLLPKARFVHCQRHPLDNCLSIYFQKFLKEHPYAYDLSEIGRSYSEYQRLMSHWRQVLPTTIFEVTYEELVSRQEQVSQELLEFCGLEWDSRCLEFHKNARPVFTASYWQVRQPIYASSIGRWKHYSKFLGSLKELLADFL
jgi:tetratricopeptide (TPR) repeat protein